MSSQTNRAGRLVLTTQQSVIPGTIADNIESLPVSYTHLTLPTIYSV